MWQESASRLTQSIWEKNNMKKLKCPKCQDDISFQAFAKALTPWNIRCSNCNSKLKGKHAGITFSISVILGIVIGLVTGITSFLFKIPFIYFMLILFLIGIVIEYIYFTIAGALGHDLKLNNK